MMNDAYRGGVETEKGYILEKEPVVAVAITETSEDTGWKDPGFIGAKPIVLETVISDESYPFGCPAADIAENERVRGVVPMSGAWRVQWVASQESDYDVCFLGYEYGGATNHNWDWVIENQIMDKDDE